MTQYSWPGCWSTGSYRPNLPYICAIEAATIGFDGEVCLAGNLEALVASSLRDLTGATALEDVSNAT